MVCSIFLPGHVVALVSGLWQPPVGVGEGQRLVWPGAACWRDMPVQELVEAQRSWRARGWQCAVLRGWLLSAQAEG